MVPFTGAAGSKFIMGDGGTHPTNLVRRHAHAHAIASNQNPQIAMTIPHRFCKRERYIRVFRERMVMASEVLNFMTEGLENIEQFFFGMESPMIATDCDSHVHSLRWALVEITRGIHGNAVEPQIFLDVLVFLTADDCSPAIHQLSTSSLLQSLPARTKCWGF